MISRPFLSAIHIRQYANRRSPQNVPDAAWLSTNGGHSSWHFEPINVVHGDDFENEAGTQFARPTANWSLILSGTLPRARPGKAFVRLHRDETNLLCTLAIDNSRSMDFPGQSPLDPRGSKLTYARYLATALSQVISLGQDQVGVAMLGENTGTMLPPGGTPTHVARVQQIIANFATQPATAMAPALRRLCEGACRGSVLMLFSDFLMDDLDAVFARLRMFRHDRWEVIALHLVHPDEERLPVGAAFRFFDPEGGWPGAVLASGNSPRIRTKVCGPFGDGPADGAGD
jgi:hypothetical protein